MLESKDGVTGSLAKKETLVIGPWGRFWKLMSEPWTLSLLLASIGLFVIGQQKYSSGVMALVQILLAVSSGVLGARVTNQLEAATGKTILEARGRVAVRGLKLMLVQTAAFQRRLQKFLANRVQIESHPEVTERNYEEAIEFCRRIQEEAASAMENWADIVPSADLSSLIGRITEAEDEHEVTKIELSAARKILESAKDGAEDTKKLQGVIETLEGKLADSENRLVTLNRRLIGRAVSDVAASKAQTSAQSRFTKAMLDAQMRQKDVLSKKRSADELRALAENPIDSDDKK